MCSCSVAWPAVITAGARTPPSKSTITKPQRNSLPPILSEAPLFGWHKKGPLLIVMQRHSRSLRSHCNNWNYVFYLFKLLSSISYSFPLTKAMLADKFFVIFFKNPFTLIFTLIILYFFSLLTVYPCSGVYNNSMNMYQKVSINIVRDCRQKSIDCRQTLYLKNKLGAKCGIWTRDPELGKLVP